MGRQARAWPASLAASVLLLVAVVAVVAPEAAAAKGSLPRRLQQNRWFGEKEMYCTRGNPSDSSLVAAYSKGKEGAPKSMLDRVDFCCPSGGSPVPSGYSLGFATVPRSTTTWLSYLIRRGESDLDSCAINYYHNFDHRSGFIGYSFGTKSECQGGYSQASCIQISSSD